jgi:hypothetical protein
MALFPQVYPPKLCMQVLILKITYYVRFNVEGMLAMTTWTIAPRYYLSGLYRVIKKGLCT